MPPVRERRLQIIAPVPAVTTVITSASPVTQGTSVTFIATVTYGAGLPVAGRNRELLEPTMLPVRGYAQLIRRRHLHHLHAAGGHSHHYRYLPGNS